MPHPNKVPCGVGATIGYGWPDAFRQLHTGLKHVTGEQITRHLPCGNHF